MMQSTNQAAPSPRDGQQLLVRFASHASVFPIHSTLNMISDTEELWYSKNECDEMKRERNRDVVALARATLLAPSVEDLEGGAVHTTSQAVGLERVVNPFQAKSKSMPLWSLSLESY